MELEQAVKVAKRAGLDLSVTPEILWLKDLPRIGWAGYSRPYIYAMEQEIRRWAEDSYEWPEGWSWIIVARRGPVFHIIDGHHRVKAARLAGLKTIPALVVSLDSVEWMDVKYGIGEFGFVEILAATNEMMRRNLSLHIRDWRESGPK